MVGLSPVFQVLLQIEVRMSIMSSLPAWTNSAGMLSTPADFPVLWVMSICPFKSRKTKRIEIIDENKKKKNLSLGLALS